MRILQRHGIDVDYVELLKLVGLLLLLLEDLPNDCKGSGSLTGSRHATDVQRAAAAALLDAADYVIIDFLLFSLSAWQLIRLSIQL